MFFYFPLSAQIGICGTLSLLLHKVGQLLASTLSTSNQSDENTISLYQQDTAHEDQGETPAEYTRLDGSRDEDKQQRAIVLHNMLLDVLLSLLTTDTLVLSVQ